MLVLMAAYYYERLQGCVRYQLRCAVLKLTSVRFEYLPHHV